MSVASTSYPSPSMLLEINASRFSFNRFSIYFPDHKMTRAYDASTTASEFVKDLYSEITGKTILTTGVSPGNLGSAFVEAIAAAKPNLLVLAGRNISKFGQTATAVSEAHPLVNFRLLELDLCSLASVRKSAEIVNSWVDVDCIDVLVNNAGIMATPYKLSPEGFESQFATNHLGHFLFTNLIMDKILTAKAPRVVMVSSDGHRLNPIRWGHYNFGVSFLLDLLFVWLSCAK